MFSTSHASKKAKPSEYGDDSLADEIIPETGLLDDLKSMGPHLGENAITLLDKVLASGEPVDDKEMLMERIIALCATLAPESKLRKKLTKKLIGGLWDSLPHPPLSYYGEEHQYRTADGSNNNPMIPDLGKAGTPYSKTVRAAKGLHGVKPDPGLLFDLLLAREDGKFKENPAGLSSMLFHHATVLIHDIFRTRYPDNNINDTSSYLDLSPLYGSNQKMQDSVRLFKDGKLKPDAFAEERLLGQPPGVCVMLVMYNRFHNHVVENLAIINDDGRFTMPSKENPKYEELLKKRDNDLFQTARLVVGGLYINISLHDYIRGITNINHCNSTWTLDPRVEINKATDGFDVARGVGNQVSAEFNLLYRFHSAVSERDDKWTEDFFKSVFGNKPHDQITPAEFGIGLQKWKKTVPEDPGLRVFGGLKRDEETGRFADDKLIEILTHSIEDPAGSFGARNIPKYLRIVEVLGIIQARKWKVASLNEFRSFFGLKRHETFESINEDPDISDLLRKLYDHPDMVELYPGLFVESAKPRMDPGSGFAANYTVGRAVLSDAITLVRGDRFNTLDYTTSTLTPWGMAEVKQDPQVLGGSTLYKLIQRSFPGWFKFNSVWVMQPMYTPKMNVEIRKELRTFDQFTVDGPKAPTKKIVLETHAAISSVLTEKSMKIRYGERLPELTFADFILSANCPLLVKDKAFANTRPAGSANLKLVESCFAQSMLKIIQREAYGLKGTYQVDITKDVSRVVCTQIHADLLNLPLSQGEKEKVKGLSEQEMYKCVATMMHCVSHDHDPAESWTVRLRAQQSIKKIKSLTEERVKSTSHGTGLLNTVFGSGARTAVVGSLQDSGFKLTKDLLAAGLTAENTATTLIMSAASGILNMSNAFILTLDWFLSPENAIHWAAVKELAFKNTPAAADTLKRYVLEAQRLSTGVTVERCFDEADKADSISIKNDLGRDINAKKGEPLVLNYIAASRDPIAFKSPNEVKLDRKLESYLLWGMGPEWCIGRETAITGITTMIKSCAMIKNLRRAPGAAGYLKVVPGPHGSKRFLTDDWSQYSPFAQTWKLQFDEF